MFGTPSEASRSHRIFPLFRSRQKTRHCWLAASVRMSTAPFNTDSNRKSLSLLTAVVRKMRSPQTMVLECPSPGISAFQATLQSAGKFCESATPAAFSPRNCGQLCPNPATANAAASTARFIARLYCTDSFAYDFQQRNSTP